MENYHARGVPNHGHELSALQSHLDIDSNLQQRIQADIHGATQHQLQGTPTQAHQYDPMTPIAQAGAIGRLQGEDEVFGTPSSASPASKRNGHIEFGNLVPDPPMLAEWRQKLFDVTVDEPIVLTDEQFHTYFPHVDNVYSHRSTQRYKRKPFVSHYYDCRLKGRPPGTPKSTDPNKKKRDRKARERDLCDVKIKVTEHLGSIDASSFALSPQSAFNANDSANFFAPGAPGGTPLQDSPQYGLGASSFSGSHSASGQRTWTIQRVNGNGGNGKSDGVGGPHRHTLEESDRIKKNSVQRFLATQDGPRKKAKPPPKQYHKRATGVAYETVKRHSKESDLKLYGSCFCPFVQRVWIALELKGIDYQYIEVDPYDKPQELMELNPRGLVPAMKHGNFSCYESTVLLDYLEDWGIGYALLPVGNPQLRAHCRLWCDHINKHITPTFYRYLQAQEVDKQLEAANDLKTAVTSLVDASDPEGPYFLGPDMCIVDVMVAPWVLRMSRVLAPYRGWPAPEPGSRWEHWVNALENNEAVKATTSTDDLYIDSYERYAENRPDTSMVARAINSGRPLP